MAKKSGGGEKGLDDFAKECLKAERQLRKRERSINRRAAVKLRDEALTNTKEAAPNLTLRVGKKGRKIGVAYRPLGVASYIVTATGPYQLVERDTKAHLTPRRRKGAEFGRTKKGKKRVYRKGKKIYIPGIGVRMYAHHPGTTGKHPFEKAVNGAAPLMEKIVKEEIADEVGETFG